MTRAVILAILIAAFLTWLTTLPQPQQSKHLPRWPLMLYSEIG